MAEPGKKALRSWRGLEKVHALVDAGLERDLKTAGLPPLIWLRALDEISRMDDGVRPFQLQDALQIEQPAVSRLLEKMTAAGVITRTECAEDRRGWRVAATQAGHATRDRMADIYAEALARHFLEYLSDKQARALDEILGDLLDGARTSRSAISSAPGSPSGT